MPTLNVLVIEDDADSRFLVADTLRGDGCAVREAEHGQRALDLLHAGRWRPDVIVLDIAMPVMDGITFLARKRDEKSLSPIPVIVISATATPPIEGASVVFGKPIDRDALLHAVRQLAA